MTVKVKESKATNVLKMQKKIKSKEWFDTDKNRKKFLIGVNKDISILNDELIYYQTVYNSKDIMSKQKFELTDIIRNTEKRIELLNNFLTIEKEHGNLV